MKSPIALLRALFDDVERLHQVRLGLDRDFLTIERRFKNEGISFLTNTLTVLADAVFHGVEHGQFSCPRHFSKCRGKEIPKLFQGILSRIFEPNTGSFKAQVDAEWILSIRQILLFFKKLSLSSCQSERLDRKAREKFWSTDASLGAVRTPLRVQGIVDRVSKVILPDLERDQGINFRNGPGAVSDSFSRNLRYDHISSYLRSGSVPDWAIREGFLELSKSAVLDTKPISRVAKLITVPKNSTSRRTITSEPALLQFLQQGLNEQLRKSIQSCPIMGRCLSLDDQGASQKLALQSSLTRELATVDLSSASDLLSISAVESVFRGREIFKRLINCRSSHIRDGRETKRMEKYAGMGNATTFPVQSIVFAVLCIASMHDYDGKDPSYWSVAAYASRIQVFGDDIIIPSIYYDSLVSMLESYGLKVNNHKSFVKGNFREACGVDAFNGTDVTPTYCKSLTITKRDPNSLASVVSLSNQLWMKGYYKSATLLQGWLEEVLGPLPLIHEKDGYFGLHNRLNARSFSRWDRRYQRRTERVYVVRSRKIPDRLDGYGALLKFFVTPLLGRDNDHLVKTSRKFDVCLKKAYA